MAWSTDPNVAERQMQAIIFCLVAFAYIDTDFAKSEKDFIKQHIGKLVDERAREVTDAALKSDVVGKWNKHYLEVLDEYDRDILCHFTESVVEGETTRDFVLAKLKLGCFQLLKGFDDAMRSTLLAGIDELMHADGTIHPSEQAFRDEVARLLEAPVELDESEIVAIEEGAVAFDAARPLSTKASDHPLLKPFEWDFADDPATFQAQAQGDLDLVEKVQKTLEAQREKGNGKLRGAKAFADFFGDEPFLDQHVYVAQPSPARRADLLVIGDLHGCYSCLKAALLQADFFGKVDRWREKPESEPVPYLVLLGDYIDRGRFSYAGTLRAVMQLYTHYPDHVFVLRGNHEYYVEIKGRVLAPVKPSEAMDQLKTRAPTEVLAAYMRLFETLPNMLVFDRTLFVHGGIPRDATVEKKWEGLHSLNDAEMRFEMLWSDPSDADAVPEELQAANARFPFGKKQFQRFMSRIGMKTMVRGHERVREGFRKVYDDPEGVLCTLFSAGGKTNGDLPADSNYREVEPMALLVRYEEGLSTITPFPIDYAKYNDPALNQFFRT